MYRDCKCPKCNVDLYIDRGLTNQCKYCGYVWLSNDGEEPDPSNIEYDKDGKLVKDPELYHAAMAADADPTDIELSRQFTELMKKRANGILESADDDEVTEKAYADVKHESIFKFTKIDTLVCMLIGVSLLFLFVADKLNLGEYANALIIPRCIALVMFIAGFVYMMFKWSSMGRKIGDRFTKSIKGDNED